MIAFSALIVIATGNASRVNFLGFSDPASISIQNRLSSFMDDNECRLLSDANFCCLIMSFLLFTANKKQTNDASENNAIPITNSINKIPRDDVQICKL